MSIGYIPLSEITNYAKTFGLIDGIDVFCKVIISLDHHYVTEMNKKSRSKTSKR